MAQNCIFFCWILTGMGVGKKGGVIFGRRRVMAGVLLITLLLPGLHEGTGWTSMP